MCYFVKELHNVKSKWNCFAGNVLKRDLNNKKDCYKNYDFKQSKISGVPKLSLVQSYLFVFLTMVDVCSR